MSNGPGPRYAIYYAPSSRSALWRFGSAVIGYDAETGADEQLLDPGLDGLDWAAATADPRRYGFHATLKAPFRLAEGHDEDSLFRWAKDFADRQPPVELEGGLKVDALGPFLALVPAEPCPALNDLAAECVRHFEACRAPLTEVERARRRPERLSERQRLHLEGWGYPYVFEDFRFHMSLTGSLADALIGPVREALQERFATKVGNDPVLIDQIAVFRQDAPDARFRIIARYELEA